MKIGKSISRLRNFKDIITVRLEIVVDKGKITITRRSKGV